MKAYQLFLQATDLLTVVPTLRDISSVTNTTLDYSSATKVEIEQSFVELGKVWQAPLFDITLNFKSNRGEASNDGLFYFFWSLGLLVYYVFLLVSLTIQVSTFLFYYYCY